MPDLPVWFYVVLCVVIVVAYAIGEIIGEARAHRHLFGPGLSAKEIQERYGNDDYNAHALMEREKYTDGEANVDHTPKTQPRS